MAELIDFYNHIADYKLKLDKRGVREQVYRISDDEIFDLVTIVNDQDEIDYNSPVVNMFTGILSDTYNKEEAIDAAKMMMSERLVLFGVQIIPDKPLYTKGRFLGI